MEQFNEFFQNGMDRRLGELRDIDRPGVVLNVGAGNKKITSEMADIVNIDYPAWDAEIMPLPFDSNSISGIHCYHFLEHIENITGVLQEFQRVLKVQGIINIVVPYYNSSMQAHDLSHKNAFCEDTWKILFKNKYYDKNQIKWSFEINFNLICGIVERNLALFTQLVKI